MHFEVLHKKVTFCTLKHCPFSGFPFVTAQGTLINNCDDQQLNLILVAFQIIIPVHGFRVLTFVTVQVFLESYFSIIIIKRQVTNAFHSLDSNIHSPN